MPSVFTLEGPDVQGVALQEADSLAWMRDHPAIGVLFAFFTPVLFGFLLGYGFGKFKREEG